MLRTTILKSGCTVWD